MNEYIYNDIYAFPEWCDPTCPKNNMFVLKKSKDNLEIPFRNINIYSVDISQFDCDQWLTDSVISDGLRKLNIYPDHYVLKQRVLLEKSRDQPMAVTNFEAMIKWDYWLNFTTWTSEDAALLFEIGPFFVPGLDVKSNFIRNKNFLNLLKILNSYIGSGKHPFDIISWASSIDCISIPVDLLTWHAFSSKRKQTEDQENVLSKEDIITKTRELLSICGEITLVAKCKTDNQRGYVRAGQGEILKVGLLSLEGNVYNTIVKELFGQNEYSPGPKWAEVRRKHFIKQMRDKHGIDCTRFMPKRTGSAK